MLCGLNIEQTLDLASRISTPVIASGGMRSLDDLAALQRAARAARGGVIEGVIVGRALYDGRLDLGAALALLAA
jgi:phosphoribosylformimino-5-aminoimidazole carboxamide ribotide isomerase